MTVEKICEKLFEMNYDELREKLEAPKKASRRVGPMFKKWLKSRFSFLDIDKFGETTDIAFLNGGNKFLKKYAAKELERGLEN